MVQSFESYQSNVHVAFRQLSTTATMRDICKADIEANIYRNNELNQEKF